MAIDEGGLTQNQHYWAKQLILILSEIFVVAPKHTLVSHIAAASKFSNLKQTREHNSGIDKELSSRNNVTPFKLVIMMDYQE